MPWFQHECTTLGAEQHSDDAHLVSFVKEEAEVGEHNPQLLPAIRVFKLSKQKAAELMFDSVLYVLYTDAGVSMPTHVHRCVCSKTESNIHQTKIKGSISQMHEKKPLESVA